MPDKCEGTTSEISLITLGPDIGGPHAPYRQSERTEIYNKLVDELVEKDLAFPCFCSDEEIDESRREAERDSLPPIYRGRWANATAEVSSLFSWLEQSILLAGDQDSLSCHAQLHVLV